jgi:hypothetical protein
VSGAFSEPARTAKGKNLKRAGGLFGAEPIFSWRETRRGEEGVEILGRRRVTNLEGEASRERGQRGKGESPGEGGKPRRAAAESGG